MHILLIEPDTVLAETYRTALVASGFSVALARTAQQAIFMADEKKPDVVVLEPQMARHNGIEFLYEFKSYPEWQKIPIIVLSVLPVTDLENMTVLRSELSVVAILSKSRTTIPMLCGAVADATKARL